MKLDKSEKVSLENLAQEKLAQEIIAAINDLVITELILSLNNDPNIAYWTLHIGLKRKPYRRKKHNLRQ